jgi:2-polyprenyl-3-methyl-5-hydroxy-6-metoxy-1,4-benzoquinol methylase
MGGGRSRQEETGMTHSLGSSTGAGMNARDAMEFINEQDEATLQRFVERLEFRGKDPTFVGYRDAYLDKMALAPTADVLDLGCGTGVVTRALAGREGFSGSVTGID